MASSPALPVAVSAISVISPQWCGDAAVWLSQMDSFFSANNVSSPEQRYALLVTSLPPAITAEVKDILISPPGSHTFEQLNL